MKAKYAFLLFWAISLLSFIPSIGAGFVYDFPGWQKEYAQGNFGDIINCFGYNGNHQFLHLIFYSFYKIFHIQGVPWYLLFCTLHAVNGLLLFQVILKWMERFNSPVHHILPFLGTVLFLIHPYCVEPVVWKVCVHYLLSLMAILFILLLFVKYLQSGVRRHLIVSCIVYAVSLFTLEISFITPLMISFAGLILWLVSDDKKHITGKIIRYGGAFWSILAGYLVLNIITLGSVVGHYGGKVHFKFDLLGIVATESRYIVKHLFYARFYSFKTKVLLFDQILATQVVSFFAMTILLALLCLYFIRIRKWKSRWHIVFFSFFTSLLFVLPVANMYFFHMQIGMNDRYSYIPMAFIIISLVALLSKINRWFSYTLIILLLFVSLYFQQKTLKYWNQSTDVLQSLKDNFRWHDAPFVFILNTPDNLNGIVMTSIINEPSGIDELIDYQTPKPYPGKMFDVFQFNMTSPMDGVKIEQTDSMQLKVTFNQWGNWWHRNGVGASSYENEYYKAETLDYPYQVTFKRFPAGSVIIYQEGKEWKEYPWKPSVQE